MALIELSNINKTFTMGSEVIRALDNVTLSIERGEFVAIVGASGCGKSTLMNILGLLDKPDAGVYRLEDQPVEKLNDDERSQLRNQKIGFVFQNFNLLARADAQRNVELPLVYSASHDKSYSIKKMNEMALEALKEVGLVERKDHKPSELSGGQRQRVAIARALVNKPRILFADEPTGNLDSKSGKEILNLFESLHHNGVTVILVTHDPNVAQKAHRIVTMLDGKIISDKTTREAPDARS